MRRYKDIQFNGSAYDCIDNLGKVIPDLRFLKNCVYNWGICQIIKERCKLHESYLYTIRFEDDKYQINFQFNMLNGQLVYFLSNYRKFGDYLSWSNEKLLLFSNDLPINYTADELIKLQKPKIFKFYNYLIKEYGNKLSFLKKEIKQYQNRKKLKKLFLLTLINHD